LDRSRFLAAARTLVDLPFVNGQRQLVAFPQKRPFLVLTPRWPQLAMHSSSAGIWQVFRSWSMRPCHRDVQGNHLMKKVWLTLVAMSHTSRFNPV
jgi:hypothetical protein